MKMFRVVLTWENGAWHTKTDEAFNLTLTSPSFDELVDKARVAITEKLEMADEDYSGSVQIAFEARRMEIIDFVRLDDIQKRIIQDMQNDHCYFETIEKLCKEFSIGVVMKSAEDLKERKDFLKVSLDPEKPPMLTEKGKNWKL